MLIILAVTCSIVVNNVNSRPENFFKDNRNDDRPTDPSRCWLISIWFDWGRVCNDEHCLITPCPKYKPITTSTTTPSTTTTTSTTTTVLPVQLTPFQRHAQSSSVGIWLLYITIIFAATTMVSMVVPTLYYRQWLWKKFKLYLVNADWQGHVAM